MTDPRQAYFDLLADDWDRMTDLDRTRRRLIVRLRELRIAPRERILDLGCGTGTSTELLAGLLGDGGCVLGIDASPRMIARARSKYDQPHIRWAVSSADALPLRDRTMHRIVCFSAWPHFGNRFEVVKELRRVVSPGGSLHILHIDSRESINALHAGLGGPVAADFLPPAADLAAILTAGGFRVESSVENDEEYTLSAVRTDAPDGPTHRGRAWADRAWPAVDPASA